MHIHAHKSTTMSLQIHPKIQLGFVKIWKHIIANQQSVQQRRTGKLLMAPPLSAKGTCCLNSTNSFANPLTLSTLLQQDFLGQPAHSAPISSRACFPRLSHIYSKLLFRPVASVTNSLEKLAYHWRGFSKFKYFYIPHPLYRYQNWIFWVWFMPGNEICEPALQQRAFSL
jgi:hypothetical protein